MAVVEFDNVCFSYRESQRALDGVSLRVDAGEFVCILGANGSGKSTLAQLANALLVPDSGTVRVNGLDTHDAANTLQVRSAVGLVFQNPDDQIVASIVEDEVAFGPGNLGLPSDELRRRVSRALDQVGLSNLGKREVASLSGGQKQLVAIAGALAMHPQVLVLDEATAMLDAAGRDNLLSVCRDLSHIGIAIVLITHRLDEAARADRVIAMCQGRIALDGPAHDVLAQADRLTEVGLIAPFTRRASEPKGRASLGSALLFQGVSYAYDKRWALRDVNLDVQAGEIVGITGPMGAGKSTFLQLAGGLLAPDEGVVMINDMSLSDKQTASTARQNIGVVFQYPEHQLFAATVFDDVAFGPRNYGLPDKEVEARVREALEVLGFDFEDVRDRSPFALSGGHQRRVAIAGVLACHPRILLMDEPTAGLDACGRRDLFRFVESLNAEHGLTVVFASHDADDLAALCDRVIRLG